MGSQESKPIWYWKSNQDPWDKQQSATWTKYSDIENDVIEDAYQQGKSLVNLNNYRIDLQSKVQMHENDHNKQRPIKREVSKENPIREERFCIIDLKPITFIEYYNSGDGSKQLVGPSVTKLYKMFCRSFNFEEELQEKFSCICYQTGKLCDICLNQRLQDRKMKSQEDTVLEQNEEVRFQEFINEVIEGIIKEGIDKKQEVEAKWITAEIKNAASRGQKALFDHIIYLYTKECFLYKVLNQALRENKLKESHNLVPFCRLLNFLILMCILLPSPQDFNQQLKTIREKFEEGYRTGSTVFGPRCPYFINKENHHLFKEAQSNITKEIKESMEEVSRLDLQYKYRGIVFRGAKLTSAMIEKYKELQMKYPPLFIWQSFTSTTKSKKKALEFGNTLFIIDTRHSPGIDVSKISAFPTEQEVLLPAYTTFWLQKILKNGSNFEIYLEKKNA